VADTAGKHLHIRYLCFFKSRPTRSGRSRSGASVFRHLVRRPTDPGGSRAESTWVHLTLAFAETYVAWVIFLGVDTITYPTRAVLVVLDEVVTFTFEHQQTIQELTDHSEVGRSSRSLQTIHHPTARLQRLLGRHWRGVAHADALQRRTLVK